MHRLSRILLYSLVFVTFLQLPAQNPAPYVHPPGKYVQVGKNKIWVELHGNGPALVLISGGPGGAHVGLHSFDSLSKQFTLVYYDAIGRGKSDTLSDVRDYTLQRDIEDLEGIRAALGFPKWNVLGHSYGGLVAQGYALQFPDRVDHLILAATFHSYEMWQKNDDNSNHEIKTNYPEVWAELMALREKGIVSSDPEHQDVYGKVPYGFLYAYNPDLFRGGRDPSYPNRFNSKLYYQMVGRDGDFIVGSDIGTFDFRRQLKDLKMPVLVFAGRYDRVAVPEFQVMYKRFCPQARFVMFERSGHNPQVEEPAACFRVIREFCGVN